MAFYDTTWYTNFGNGSSTGYYAVTVRPQNTAVAAGVLRRQFTAPAVGSERVFVCIVAGTTANVTDATWVLTRGAKTTDGTATWQECTGTAAVNGDATNTVTWATAKAAGTPTLGAIIKRNSGASYQICTTAGTMAASEPSFSDTAGVTTNDGTSVWTSLGPVGNFTGGQAPHARLANATASGWYVGNNTIYVGNNHAESQATAISITPVTNSILARFLCHNASGTYPPGTSDLATGATISTTAAVNITFGAGGYVYIYGLTFKAGVGSSSVGAGLFIANTVNCWHYYDNCSFWLSSTAAASNIAVHGTSGSNQTIWNNCTVKFANAIQYVNPQGGAFIWQNTGQVLASGSTVPTALIGIQTTGQYHVITLDALDLSQLTSNLFSTNNPNEAGSRLVKDCKLNASTTIQQGGAVTSASLTIQNVRSDSGATAYKSARYSVEGTETTETSITRVGGAVDPSGQAQSRKLVTTANAQWVRPFAGEPYAIWNTVTGATVTVTVYGTINSGTLPLTDEIWMEIEYLGSSAQPLSTIVNTTKATVLSTGTSVASDSSTWNGGGSGGGWSPFKLVATLSSPQPAMAGYLEARIRAAKASTTYYIDPKIELT